MVQQTAVLRKKLSFANRNNCIMWRIQQQQFQVSRASSYKYSGGKPPSRWQEVPDWGDKLPRKASVQHYEPCLKHLSTGPPDQENTPISKSRLHRCFAKSNKKA
jgi:hypothetical protein